MSGQIPVDVLTGFLGSGKTTLLRHLLSSPAFSDCAVLVNEFGEIGLDHHLIADVSGDVVLMQSGCICCTIRGDLSEAIRGLYARREQGEVGFARLVIETTGLADPTPILSTIMHEPQIRHHFRLGTVIATVDAVNGMAHLRQQPESVKQVAVADSIVVTKVDLADAALVDMLETRLVRINPAARRCRSGHAPPPDAWLLAAAPGAEEARAAMLDNWPRPGDGHGHDGHGHDGRGHDGRGHDVSRHDERIRSFTVNFPARVDWNVFAVWFTLLLQSHGSDVLRVKGMLRIVGAAGPVVVNAVQHLVHPPLHLEVWPEDWQQSRLVFIVRDLSSAGIEASFAAFHALLGVGLDQAEA